MARDEYLAAAEHVLRNGLSRFPEQDDLEHLLLMTLILDRRPAVEVMSVAREIGETPGSADWASGQIAAAYVRFKNGNPERALAALAQALLVEPAYFRAEMLFLRAILLRESGNKMAAEAQLKEALASQPPLWLSVRLRNEP